VIKVKERDTLTSNRGPDLNLADPPFNAQERDIDLMLLEEIHCEPTFLAWIAEQAGISNGSLVQARHSVYRGNGETDVLVFVDTPKGRTALMVEDKIGAEMQPRQAERYRERGDALCAEGTINSYRTLLCAPQGYLQGVPPSDWHATLSFEAIAKWFEQQGNVRARWRCDTLRRAEVRQHRSAAGTAKSPIMTANSEVAKFKRDYREYVISKYKEFVLTIQLGIDKEYYFTERQFPSYIRLKHSFSRSSVFLVSEKQWNKKARVVLKDGFIPDTTWTEPHDSTLHLVTGTEPIDYTESVESQKDLIDTAMEAARRLLPYATMVQQAPG